MNLPPLKCNGCTTCCQGDAIPLIASDDPSLYKTKRQPDGTLTLAKGKDGNCIYLGKRGCQRHNQPRPHYCRIFDCRAYALMVETWSDEKREARMAIPQNRRTILEGRRRLGKPAEPEGQAGTLGGA